MIEAEWYDYEAKYTPGGMELIVPARIPDEVAERVRSLAVEVFRRSAVPGMARCDFFVEDPEGEGRVLVNELNTIPGFTETSVYAKLFEASGVPYPDLLDRLLELALERHGREGGYCRLGPQGQLGIFATPSSGSSPLIHTQVVAEPPPAVAQVELLVLVDLLARRQGLPA